MKLTKSHNVVVTIEQNRGENKQPYHRVIGANAKKLGLLSKDNSKGIDRLVNGIAGHIFYMAEKGKEETSCKLLDIGKPISVQIESPILDLNTAKAEIQVELKVARQKRPARLAKAIKFLIEANSMTFEGFATIGTEDSEAMQKEATEKAKSKPKAKTTSKTAKAAPRKRATAKPKAKKATKPTAKTPKAKAAK